MVIPAYSSIAPDGTMTDISNISAVGSSIIIEPSPFNDVIYLNSEENDQPIVQWSAGDDYIYGPNSGTYFIAHLYNYWPYDHQANSKGLTFEVNEGILTVASDYGVNTVDNISNIYVSRSNDIFIGDENSQNFRGEGGNDTFTGGGGEDHFRLASWTYFDTSTNSYSLYDSFARITDFENDDKISIENYGFSDDLNIVEDQFYITQDFENDKTYISIDTPLATINNMFEIDGVFYLDYFYLETEYLEGHGGINLRIKLTDLIYHSTNGDDILGPLGDWREQDSVFSGLDQSYVLTGGLGNDVLGGGSKTTFLMVVWGHLIL